MPSKQTPSADRFVIRTRGGSGRKALGGVGTLEEIPGSDLLLLRTDAAGRGCKAVWEEILARLGPGDWVAPLFVDEGGAPHYPTGDVTVRFAKALSDREIEAFGSAHGLRARERNEFVPEQVCYRPLEPRQTYLPELLAALGRDKSVVATWANTVSRYERR